MAMFKVDRASAAQRPFDKPGTYTVTVVKTQGELTSKGDHVVRMLFRSADGCVVSDSLFNGEKSWWRLNQLLVACPEITIKDGEELELTNNDVFDAFCARFEGQKLCVKLEEETYVKGGETKKVLRVKRFLPDENPF